jgi:hypothetical protein
MTVMALPKIIPALADLTQDMAGPVPLSLLYGWAAGEQDAARAAELLAPFRLEGTVVSSDTSGLSRLTKERDLLDVLALISEPKQILHGIGVEIGGKAIGTWVADNTQVFYPPSVAAADIVSGMSEAERRISCELTIGVGMCVHRGIFYELGGALYGGDAHLVETHAEHHARPGEILVTAPIKDDCPGEYTFRPRPELDTPGGPPIFSLAEAPRGRGLEGRERRYPHPYPAAFFDRLLKYKRASDRQALRQEIYDAYLRSAVVVFLSRSREPGALWDGAFLLDDLVANVLLDALVSGLDSARGHVAGLGGGLGILTFDTPDEAFENAQALRRRFASNGLLVKIGIASGPVLHFSNPRGPSGITGTPVNVASKISEDGGLPGRINIAADVASQIGGLDGASPFEISVGGVVLHGVTV